jgi:hypothetical protein
MKTKCTELVKEIGGKGKNIAASLKTTKKGGKVRGINTLGLRYCSSKKCDVIIQSRSCGYQNEITYKIIF